MNHLEKLNEYLKENDDIACCNEVRDLIKLRVAEMDRALPKLMNKAFNCRYTISRIEKAELEGKEGLSGTKPDYNAQLQNQYRQICLIHEKINKMKIDYEKLEKVMITIRLLNNYHLELNSVPQESSENGLTDDLKEISSKYLFNVEYEQKLIDGYKSGLIKEGLALWNIRSLNDIKSTEKLS